MAVGRGAPTGAGAARARAAGWQALCGSGAEQGFASGHIVTAARTALATAASSLRSSAPASARAARATTTNSSGAACAGPRARADGVAFLSATRALAASTASVPATAAATAAH